MTNSSWALVSSRPTPMTWLPPRAPPGRTAFARSGVETQISRSMTNTERRYEAISFGHLTYVAGTRERRIRPPPQPDAEIAAITALAPGIASTRIPASRARVTSSCPGSDTSGVPASETSAMDSPAFNRSSRVARLLVLVVGVEARRARRDGVVLKKPRCPASVLGRDEGDFAQNPEGAQRDIFEVADRCGDHIQDAGHARGADLTRMYSAEPLPHFVDEYLAWLHEAHPTNATFDGVHLHDDLLEDLSRAAIDAPDPGPRRLRPAAGGDRSDASHRRRAPRTPGARSQHPGTPVRAGGRPHLGAQPAALRRPALHQPCRARFCSTTRRCRSVPGACSPSCARCPG